MYEPPPGNDDMLADARRVPLTGEFHDLDVPAVGLVRARAPMPASAAVLAAAANAKTHDATHEYLTRFVCDHVGDDEYERLMLGMMSDECPHDTIGKVGLAVATCGTARPYRAVINLATVAAHHWRHFRALYHSHGIPDPLTALSSMHALLDDVEKLLLEQMAAKAKDQATLDRERAHLMDQLYQPDPDVNGRDYERIPAGFESPAEVEADFGAAMRALTGSRRRAR